jgi:anti-anti-sigma regulatory factor
LVFSRPFVSTGIAWGAAFFGVLLQVLMRRGYVREASVLFLSLFWVLITLVVLFSGSIRATISSFYVAVTVMSGLLLGARVALGMAGFNVLVTLGLLYLEKADRIPPSFFRGPATAAWLELAMNLVLTGVAVALTLRGLATALSRAHESERTTAAQAVEMREVNARLAREIAEREEAEAEREEAEAERERLLAEQTVLQQQVIEAQRQTLRELSSPIIPVLDQVLVMPLIGSIDAMRAKQIMRTVLQGIDAHHASVIILDVTGVLVMDTGIIGHLNKTIQAARLKGAHIIMTGISDAVAEAIVDGGDASHGINWGTVETLANLQKGLHGALGRLGLTISRKGR